MEHFLPEQVSEIHNLLANFIKDAIYSWPVGNVSEMDLNSLSTNDHNEGTKDMSNA